MKLSPWTPIPSHPYCCARVCEGGDIENVNQRVAFIEKTPRVRIRDNDRFDRDMHDWLNWAEAPFSGPGGSDGADPAKQLYGFYPPSRQWCDDMLKLLGYELS